MILANIKCKNAKIWLWVLTASYALVLFFLSIKSNLPVEQKFSNQDKILHFFAYFILGILVFSACYKSFNSLSFFAIALITIVACTLYGIFNEIMQIFVSNRQPSFYDAVANSLGSVIASLWGKKWILK